MYVIKNRNYKIQNNGVAYMWDKTEYSRSLELWKKILSESKVEPYKATNGLVAMKDAEAKILDNLERNAWTQQKEFKLSQ